MLITIYLLLIPVSLVLWIWLTKRLWRVSPAAAGTSFFLLFPAIYWCWKLWNDPDAHIRVPAIANGLITLVLLLMSYRIGTTELDRFLDNLKVSVHHQEHRQQARVAAHLPAAVAVSASVSVGA
ncbi:hypothetical protein [Actimicrobium antarcticum]|uniref:Uncharacterized protein n=1 Tax=Actimicrobium antarcticum TaxID=1051899 RepID=A0ABP7U0R2_9BURK